MFMPQESVSSFWTEEQEKQYQEEQVKFHKEMNKLIEDGYLLNNSEGLVPVKCTSCESTEMKDKTVSTDGGHLSEFSRQCGSCGVSLGYWSYGGWNV